MNTSQESLVLFLLLFILILVAINIYQRRKYVILQEKSHDLNARINDLNYELRTQKNLNEYISKEYTQLNDCLEKKDELYQTLIEGSEGTLRKISTLISDFHLLQFEISQQYLETKKHPARKEAKRIRELISESKIFIEQYRQMFYRYEILLQLFPELSMYVEDIEDLKMLENRSTLEELNEDFDRVQLYLSKDEFQKLSLNERNQLALDNYIRGQKSNWQIGRDYELFCGQQYEKKGWEVLYFGMEMKMSDLGRDLITKKGNEHQIVQCKYWSVKKGKRIHENHITQLFGSAIEYSLGVDESIKVTPVFITNTQLTEVAQSFANKLGVKVLDNYPLKDFPRIKCNVGKDEYGYRTLIYHLPFDQQYDRTKIRNEGDFYAFTVKEADEAGFRRAYRYFGS